MKNKFMNLFTNLTVITFIVLAGLDKPYANQFLYVVNTFTVIVSFIYLGTTVVCSALIQNMNGGLIDKISKDFSEMYIKVTRPKWFFKLNQYIYYVSVVSVTSFFSMWWTLAFNILLGLSFLLMLAGLREVHATYHSESVKNEHINDGDA